MKYAFMIISFLFFMNIIVNCFIHPVDEEEYNILLKLANGNFLTPVKDPTTKEKSAVVKFWRAKGKYTTDCTGKILLYENKKVYL